MIIGFAFSCYGHLLFALYHLTLLVLDHELIVRPYDWELKLLARLSLPLSDKRASLAPLGESSRHTPQTQQRYQRRSHHSSQYFLHSIMHLMKI